MGIIKKEYLMYGVVLPEIAKARDKHQLKGATTLTLSPEFSSWKT